ncbi:MAG TPA: ABC transporter ATP-binding protein [Chloroflexia bacterium]|nr:ABC transporter ATP-binding protein [Chloroflexia bacterium]
MVTAPTPAQPPAIAGPTSPGRRAVIQVEHVSKKFGDTMGVEDVSFEVYEGEIFGFIGPSGSGKTTTMRLLNGIYTPTEGKVRLLGTDPAHPTRALHEGFGYMPQQFVLYPNLTVYENLNFMAGVYGLGWRERRKQIDTLLGFVELTEARNRLAANISGGMQRRLELAASLIHNPRLLFVDEPTAGIDPVLRGKFWDEFRRLRDSGRTIFVTTQYVGESEYCDRVGVIRKGKLLALGTPLELRRIAMQGDIVDLEAPDLSPTAIKAVLTQPFVITNQGKPVYSWERSANNAPVLRVHVAQASEAIPLMMQALQGAGVTATAVQEYRPTFDEVFIQLMGDLDDSVNAE